MSDEQKQPALPPVEQETLISGKIVGILKKILYNGFPVAARFTKSVRVGSGTHSTFDGTDGVIAADGTSGQFLAYDIGGSANLVQFYRDATTFYFGTTEGGVAVHAVNATTGQLTQPARTTLTAGTNITLNATGFAAQGSRLVKPVNYAEVQVSLTASAAIAAGAVVATVAAGHRPTVTVAGTVNKLVANSVGAAVPVSLFVNAAGQVVLGNATLANTDTLVGTLFYPIV